jgi:anti-sigma regulatory factor (Ser/Thr protein kinase)
MKDPVSRHTRSQSRSKKPPKTSPGSASNSVPNSAPNWSPDLSSGTQEIVVYPAQFVNLDHVREFVGAAAQKCGLDASAIYAVQLAVDEAFSNIIEHAYGGECLDKIECKCQIADSGLTVTLRDCGSPFDPSAIPDPDLAAELKDRDIGGLGLYFIRQLMDEVQFSFVPDPETGRRCNVLQMQKRKES